MKNLFTQFIRFGLVGAVCFVIDYVIGLAVMNIVLALTTAECFEAASVAGSVVGFTVSVVVNYVLSFKYVFARKENLDRRAEFTAFLILSVIGLLLNSLLIWLVVGPVYSHVALLREGLGHNLIYTGAKVFATAVVMVYNFATRKIFLEQRDSGTGKEDASI